MQELVLSPSALRYHAEEAARMAENLGDMPVLRADAMYSKCFGLSTPISGDHLRALPGGKSIWDLIPDAGRS